MYSRDLCELTELHRLALDLVLFKKCKSNFAFVVDKF